MYSKISLVTAKVHVMCGNMCLKCKVETLGGLPMNLCTYLK